MIDRFLYRLLWTLLGFFIFGAALSGMENRQTTEAAVCAAVMLVCGSAAGAMLFSGIGRLPEIYRRSRNRRKFKKRAAAISITAAARDPDLLNYLAQSSNDFQMTGRGAAAQTAVFYELYLKTLIAVWEERGREAEILAHIKLKDLQNVFADREFSDTVIKRYSILRTRLRAAQTAGELAAASTGEPLAERTIGAFLRDFSTRLLDSIADDLSAGSLPAGADAESNKDEDNEWEDVIY